MLEGIEVVFIAVGAGGKDLLVPTNLGALATLVIFTLLGLLLHHPLSAIRGRRTWSVERGCCSQRLRTGILDLSDRGVSGGRLFFRRWCSLAGYWWALIGAAIWGLDMGVHESIVPAAITPMVASERRASAFELFTAAYGIFWFVDSAAIGILYDPAIPFAVAFCVAAELLAIPVFIWVGRRYDPDLQMGRSRQ